MTLTMQKIGPLFGDMADDDMTQATLNFIQTHKSIGAATVRVTDGKIVNSRWAIDMNAITRIQVKEEKDDYRRATPDEICQLIEICVIHELAHCCCTDRHSDDGMRWTTFIGKAIGYPDKFLGQVII